MGRADRLDAERLSKEDVAQLRRHLQQARARFTGAHRSRFRTGQGTGGPVRLCRRFSRAAQSQVLQHRQLNWSPALASAQVDELLDVFARPLPEHRTIDARASR